MKFFLIKLNEKECLNNYSDTLLVLSLMSFVYFCAMKYKSKHSSVTASME